MIKRIQNLWYLSGLDIASDSFRQIKLSVPHKMGPPKRKLASIIEDKPDNFKEEPVDESLRQYLERI